jgi:hemoglobin
VKSRPWLSLLASLLLLAACASAPPRDDSLYRALGERAGIARTVDAILLRVLADARINELFSATDPAQLAPLLVEQICEAAGGPCQYSGRSMEETHTGLNITDAQFAAFVEDTVAGMNAEKVPAEAQARLLETLGAMKPQIVGR